MGQDGRLHRTWSAQTSDAVLVVIATSAADAIIASFYQKYKHGYNDTFHDVGHAIFSREHFLLRYANADTARHPGSQCVRDPGWG